MLIGRYHSFKTIALILNQTKTKIGIERHIQFVMGVSQGSILRPLLFNIFLCDLFQFFPDLDISNYADDNTSHSTNINLNKVLHDLERNVRYFIQKIH